MSYRIAGIDVHKKMLAVAVADVEVYGDFHFERQKVAHIKISSLVSDLLGISARRMLQALADGETDPAALATLATAGLRCHAQAAVRCLPGGTGRGARCADRHLRHAARQGARSSSANRSD